MTLRILLADDHILFREGLKSLLQSEKDITVVGEAVNGRDAVIMCDELCPDIAIIDVAMPELNGIEAAKQILQISPQTRIIALSMHAGRRYVLDMLKAGAVGYLLKDCAFQELTLALDAVRNRKVYLSPAIAGKVVEQLSGNGDLNGIDKVNLTGREKEILQLLTEGNKARVIAERLHISIKTVQTHRRNIMEKLDLHNLADLTKYAIRIGLITHE